jgi:hypothetical protein
MTDATLTGKAIIVTGAAQASARASSSLRSSVARRDPGPPEQHISVNGGYTIGL